MASKKKSSNQPELKTSELVAELVRLWKEDETIVAFSVSGPGNIKTISVMDAVEGQRPRLHVRHKNGMCLTQHGWIDEPENDDEPSTLTQKKFINKFPDTCGTVWKIIGAVVASNDDEESAEESVEPPEDVRRALRLGEELLDAIENDVPEHAFDKASDFFEDVQAKAKEVCETIRKTNRVTEAQESALESWDAGVRRWIR